MNKRLLILGCADRKRETDGWLPALDLYDGPAYRVVRNFLRDYQWPEDLSIAVLSAKYGLFGILKGIEHYNQRMDLAAAKSKVSECSTILDKWAAYHRSVHVSLGKNYIPAVRPALDELNLELEVFEGGIGQKLNQVKSFLRSKLPPVRDNEVEAGTGSFRYFLPDWDDLLDPRFDFEGDRFSRDTRAQRGDKHCCVLMQPHRMSDGILLSLAQKGIHKGPLKRLEGTEPDALSRPPLRTHFGLSSNQYLFGDCGAYSYVNEESPTISVDQAVALYESYGFDFGASVDHIPVPMVSRNGKRIKLPDKERKARVETTRKNAQLFIESARNRKVRFNPVGIIQGLTPEQYAQSVVDYCELGYRHLALGGLIPKGDKEIAEITRSVIQAADILAERPWIHLFGIYRPKLQGLFRQLKIDSFDSASYFRKSWLRSDQNYLGANGRWYAALRVPKTEDGRTRRRLMKMDADIERLRLMEWTALRLLSQYDKGHVNIKEVLDAVLEYDRLLARSSDTKSMREKYQRTLIDRPWRNCQCTFCKELGIHMLIFRGANRNKRRGAHNTLMLYGNITKGRDIDTR